MAGNRRAAAADDQTKKRKRVSDADAKAKRTKQDGKAVTSKKRQDAPAAAEASPAPADKTGQRNLELVTKPTDSEAGWRISRPMGGRMLDIDPILTVDEQYVSKGYHPSHTKDIPS